MLSHFVFETTVGQWLLALVIVAVLALLVRTLNKLALFAHNAAEKAATENHSAIQVMMLRAGDALARCAADAVAYVEATMRPQILGAATGGKLDTAQAKQLKDAAVTLALEQARLQFGKALERIGVTNIGEVHETISSLVENAAQRLAGDSRAKGAALLPLKASA